jgi:hypothetical protein
MGLGAQPLGERPQQSRCGTPGLVVVSATWSVRLARAHRLQVASAVIAAAVLFGCTLSPKLPSLPNTGIASGREECTVAPNGAADCSAAARALCHAKGFETGASTNTETEYCFDKANGRIGNCTFVTRASCH